MPVDSLVVKDANNVDREVRALPEIMPVSALALPLPDGAATQTTLAAILAKIIASPATEAGQTAIINALAALSTSAGQAALLSALQGPLAVGSLPALPAGGALIGKVDHAATGLGHGMKTVAASATPEVLASSTAAKWVTIQAYRSNTGFVAIGGSNTVNAAATAGTGTGLSLAAGESVTLLIDNLADVWLAVTVNGEGARYTFGT
jgi:hypothetical protein